MTLLPEDFIQLLLAILIGGLIGAEREYRDKPAGLHAPHHPGARYHSVRCHRRVPPEHLAG